MNDMIAAKSTTGRVFAHVHSMKANDKTLHQHDVYHEEHVEVHVATNMGMDLVEEMEFK